MKKFVEDYTELIVGLAAVLFLSFAQSVFSAVFGPLGTAPGMEVGPWIIGKISRYWDPIIVGATTSFAVWAWKHAPPARRMAYYVNAVDEDADWKIGLITTFAMTLFLGATEEGCLVALLCVPYGKYGLVVAMPAFAILFWIALGSTATGLLILSVFVGLWGRWWIVSFAKDVPVIWRNLKSSQGGEKSS